MDFKLTRDLVFLDLETTGLQVLRDRIVQIALIKYQANGGEPIEMQMLVNPGIPISEEAMAVHGITPDDLRNKPTFQQVGQSIYEFIGDADLGGYNSARFDIPMLTEEFARIGIQFDMSKRRQIDVQRIFYKMEPRTLRAAMQFYCGQELTDAHDAMADVKATVEVFKGQLRKYEHTNLIDEEGVVTEQPIRNDIQALHNFTNDLKTLDATQKLKLNAKGEVCFNFGKYQDQPVADVIKKEKNYGYWILNKEFSSQVKQIVKGIMDDLEKKG